MYVALVFADFLFAYLSIRQQGKERTSKSRNKGVRKKFATLAFPFVLVTVCRESGIDDANATTAINSLMSLLIASEGYSIMRHIYNINTGKNLPEMQVFDILVEKCSTLIQEKMDAILAVFGIKRPPVVPTETVPEAPEVPQTQATVQEDDI